MKSMTNRLDHKEEKILGIEYNQSDSNRQKDKRKKQS
jgi:hypothetical protein